MTIEAPSFLITIHNTHASLVSAYDLSILCMQPFLSFLFSSVCGDLVTSEMVNAPVNLVSLYVPRCALE